MYEKNKSDHYNNIYHKNISTFSKWINENFVNQNFSKTEIYLIIHNLMLINKHNINRLNDVFSIISKPLRHGLLINFMWKL